MPHLLLKPITMMAWIPDIIALFLELRVSINFSLFLSLFDPKKWTSLKNDWIAEGVGWIMMQPSVDKESQTATVHIKNTRECLFGLSKHGSWLKPAPFGSRSCDDMEIKYQYCTGKVAAGRWVISQNHPFLLGYFLYWLCEIQMELVSIRSHV